MGSPIWRQLLLQLILILVNAFFAASEIAVISLNTARLRKMVEEGDRSVEKILKFAESPSGFLSTIQVGITLAGFLGSAFAAENFSDRLVNWIVNDVGFTKIPTGVLNTVAVIVITVILAYFTLVFGELVPKRIAMQKPLPVAKGVVGVISVVGVVVKPVVWLLTASTNLILRILRLKTETEDEAVTEEDIRLMADIGEEGGTIEPQERELIDNIFEFSDTVARDVMKHYRSVTFINVNASAAEITTVIESTGYSRYPVYEGDFNKILGILHAKTFFLNQREPSPKPLRDILNAPYYVPETAHTDALFREMQRRKQHFAIVAGEYGETRGILTMEDLIEEIFGSIYDESDKGEDSPEITAFDGGWHIAGTARLEDVEQATGAKFDSERADTIGGLVLSQLPSVPEDGAKFTVTAGGLSITVTQIKNRQVIMTDVATLIPEAGGKDE